MSIQGGIIAGGKGLRLGGCLKALIELPSGTTIVERTTNLLTKVCGCPPLLSANEVSAFAHLPSLAGCYPDEESFGPLSGLLALLAATKSDALLLVAGDMPDLCEELLQGMVSHFKKHGGPGLWLETEQPRPFPMILATDTLEAVEAYQGQGQRSLWRLLDVHLEVPRMKAESWLALDPQQRTFDNINTPEDLERLHCQ